MISVCMHGDILFLWVSGSSGCNQPLRRYFLFTPSPQNGPPLNISSMSCSWLHDSSDFFSPSIWAVAEYCRRCLDFVCGDSSYYDSFDTLLGQCLSLMHCPSHNPPNNRAFSHSFDHIGRHVPSWIPFVHSPLPWPLYLDILIDTLFKCLPLHFSLASHTCAMT